MMMMMMVVIDLRDNFRCSLLPSSGEPRKSPGFTPVLRYGKYVKCQYLLYSGSFAHSPSTAVRTSKLSVLKHCLHLTSHVLANNSKV